MTFTAWGRYWIERPAKSEAQLTLINQTLKLNIVRIFEQIFFVGAAFWSTLLAVAWLLKCEVCWELSPAIREEQI